MFTPIECHLSDDKTLLHISGFRAAEEAGTIEGLEPALQLDWSPLVRAPAPGGQGRPGRHPGMSGQSLLQHLHQGHCKHKALGAEWSAFALTAVQVQSIGVLECDFSMCTSYTASTKDWGLCDVTSASAPATLQAQSVGL